MEKLIYAMLITTCVSLKTHGQIFSPKNSKKQVLYTQKSIPGNINYSLPGEIAGDLASGGSAIDLNPGRLRLHPPVPPMLILPRPELNHLPEYFWIDENIKIDCVWVNAYEYYSVWNSTRLNPYNFDGLSLSDTLELPLFKTDKGEKGISPLDRAIVTSDFGLRKAQWHYGSDIRIKTGAPVYTPFDGIVRIQQYERRGFGRYIVIRHRNGLESLFGHLSKVQVKVGDIVKSGDIIAFGGNTGRSTAPHLHFEVRYMGNAIDPNKIYNFKTNSLKDSVLTVTPTTFAYLTEARAIRNIIIRRGDTLSELSVKHGVPVGKLCALNGISRKSILRIGQKLRIN